MVFLKIVLFFHIDLGATIIETFQNFIIVPSKNALVLKKDEDIENSHGRQCKHQ